MDFAEHYGNQSVCESSNRNQYLGSECSVFGELSNGQQLKFQVPAVEKPEVLLRHWTDDRQGTMKVKIAHGTTTLAFRYQGGLVVAVDSRATAGSYIASQTVKKVIEINPYLLGTMAGGAADCSFWERQLSVQCRLHELRNKHRISVAAASKVLANMVYQYKGMGLSMGTMVAGVNQLYSTTETNTGSMMMGDEEHKFHDQDAFGLYYVDNDGTRLKGKVFSVGSGSTYAYGVLDNYYDYELDKSSALEVGKRSIFHAAHRDAASGGVVNLYHIDSNGWEKISQSDVTELYYEYTK